MQDENPTDTKIAELRQQLRPMKPLIDSVAREMTVNDDARTDVFYRAALRYIPRHTSLTPPKIGYCNFTRSSHFFRSDPPISQKTIGNCLYNPDYESELHSRIRQNIDLFLEHEELKAKRTAQKEMRNSEYKAERATVLEAKEQEKQRWLSSLTPLKPLIEEETQKLGVTEITDSICRAAVTNMPNQPAHRKSPYYIYVPGGNYRYDKILLHKDITPDTIGDCYYDPQLVEATRTLVASNVSALLDKDRNKRTEEEIRVAKKDARMAEQLATEKERKRWFKTLVPLKPLIDEEAHKLGVDEVTDPLYQAAMKNIANHRLEGAALRYAYACGGVYHHDVILHPSMIDAETIKDCYFDPVKRTELQAQIAESLKAFLTPETSRAIENEQSARLSILSEKPPSFENTRRELLRRRQNALELLSRPGVRYLRLEPLLKDAGRSGKECKILTNRLAELCIHSGDGRVFYQGVSFEPGDIVALEPSHYNDKHPWNERVKHSGKVHLTPQAAEKLATLIKGEKYRLPLHMPADWFSDANDLPEGESGPEKDMRLKKVPRRRISR